MDASKYEYIFSRKNIQTQVKVSDDITNILGTVKHILNVVKKTNTNTNSMDKKLGTLTWDNQGNTSCHILEYSWTPTDSKPCLMCGLGKEQTKNYSKMDTGEIVKISLRKRFYDKDVLLRRLILMILDLFNLRF